MAFSQEPFNQKDIRFLCGCLFGLFVSDPVQFLQDHITALIAKHWQSHPCAAQLVKIKLSSGNTFLIIGGFYHQFAIRVIDSGSAPEVQAVFEANAIGVSDKGCEQPGISAIDGFYPLRRAENFFCYTPPW